MTRKASPLNGHAISKTRESRPCSGCARSALPPSAAIVRAARQMDWTPSGKVLNSFSAALIHEIGRVFRTSGIHDHDDPYGPYIVISDNSLQLLGVMGRTVHIGVPAHWKRCVAVRLKCLTKSQMFLRPLAPAHQPSHRRHAAGERDQTRRKRLF